MINEYRPRFGEEWRGTLEEIRQLGPERVKAFLQDLKEYNPKPKVKPYKEEHTISPGSSRKRGLLLPCVHAPFHNVAQMTANLELIEHIKPDFLIIMGDFMEAFAVSAHNKGEWAIPGLTLQDEYNQTNVLLDMLDEAMPSKCEKVYIEGNHEERIRRFKKPIDNAKLGGAIIDYNAGLNLSERGYVNLAPYREARCNVGDLLVIHGLFFGIHAASQHLRKINQNLVHCHTHRVQTFSNGEFTAYNIGWGGDVNNDMFRYMAWFQRKSWTNMCSVVDLHESGKTTVTPLQYDGQYFFEGKVF